MSIWHSRVTGLNVTVWVRKANFLLCDLRGGLQTLEPSERQPLLFGVNIANVGSHLMSWYGEIGVRCYYSFLNKKTSRANLKTLQQLLNIFLLLNCTVPLLEVGLILPLPSFNVIGMSFPLPTGFLYWKPKFLINKNKLQYIQINRNAYSDCFLRMILK